MTMALAVALVACSGAAGTPGPKGDTGPQGPPGKDAPTPDPDDPTTPTTPVEPGPVQNIKGIDPFIFNDDAVGAMDTEPQTINVSDRFYPSTGLMYSIEGYSQAKMDRIDASVTEDGMLTVMLKSGAKYMNDALEVKATDGTSSDKVMFYVRRNRAPMNKSTTNNATGAPTTAIIWVTEEEMTVSAKDVNVEGSSGDIPVVIGELKKPTADAPNTQIQDPFFFHDDAGNKLSFVSDLSVGDAKKLMVVDGEMKVTLTGIKSTHDSAAATDKHTPISLMVSAMDDGGLVSDNEEHVLTIHIDTAPTTKGSIGTKVITLGTTMMDRVGIPDIANYFTDDRESDDLDYYAWSDNPEVVLVSVNPENKKDLMIDDLFDFDGDDTGDEGDGFYVEGKGRGTAMIMVQAKEKEDATAFATLSDTEPGSAGKKQSVTLTFMVEVK